MKRIARNGGKRKREAAVQAPPGAVEVEEDKVPKSFVVKLGKVAPEVSELVREMRNVMEPHTAQKLKERKNNTVKDFAVVARPLGVTHLCFFSQTENSLIYRIARVPEGPTLTFKISQYCLKKHVRKLQRKKFESPHAYQTSPLVVLNNFGDENSTPTLKLMKITLQNMFPTINIATVKVNECRRLVLFHYEKATNSVEMRHYAVRVTPTGLSKAVKKVVNAKIPNLHNAKDMSEFVKNGGLMSDSEVEDEDSKVILPNHFVGQGGIKSQKSSIRLHELGPRITMSLYKAERGLVSGDVLYHSYIKKTPEEIKALQRTVKTREDLKEKRRDEQNSNVARKRLIIEEKKAKKKQRMEARNASQNGAQGIIPITKSAKASD